MQHAEHFLSRLDRLPRSEVDLALALYRDPELLRAVLDAASLPEGAERAAISIDDPVTGPFVIVTRGGHFVTCLGRGMRASNLPVVTRDALDAIARRLTRLRETMEIERRLRGTASRASALLLRRLLHAPDSVSREDFLEVAAWEPLFGQVFMQMYLDMSIELHRQSALLLRARVRGARGDEALHTHWNLLHAAGHMALLGAISAERERYTELTADMPGSRAAFSYALTGTGVITFILKGAWAAGRLGKLMLHDYKRALTEDVALFELFDTLFALLAIGTRSRGTSAEIVKALRAAPEAARTPEARRLRELMGREVAASCELTAQLLESPAEELAAARRELGEAYLDMEPALPDDAIRDELIRTLPLVSWADGITTGKKLGVSLMLIAATARGEPEQLYLPRELLRALRRPWEPADTRMVLEPRMKASKAQRRPDVRPPPVGRNDPCPCGSGKKWKRCCGA